MRSQQRNHLHAIQERELADLTVARLRREAYPDRDYIDAMTVGLLNNLAQPLRESAVLSDSDVERLALIERAIRVLEARYDEG